MFQGDQKLMRSLCHRSIYLARLWKHDKNNLVQIDPAAFRYPVTTSEDFSYS